MKRVDDQILNDAAKSYRVLNHRREAAQKAINQAGRDVKQLGQDFQELNDELDALLDQASELLEGDLDFTDEDRAEADRLLQEIEAEYTPTRQKSYEKLETLDIDGSWNNLVYEVEDYARRNEINFGDDPFEGLLTQTERNRIGEKIRSDYMVVIDADERKSALEAYLSFGMLFVSSGAGSSGDREEQINQLCGKMADLLHQYVHIDPKYNHSDFKEKPRNINEWLLYLSKYYPELLKGAGVSPEEVSRFPASSSDLEKALSALAKRPTWVGLSFSMICQFVREDAGAEGDSPLFIVNGSDGAELVGRTTGGKLIAGFVNWLDALSRNPQVYPHNIGDDKDVRSLVMALLQKCGFGESDQEGVVKSIQEFAIDIYNSLHGEEDQIDGKAVQVGVCNYIMKFLAALQCRADGSPYAKAINRVDEKFVHHCQVAGYGMIDILLKGSKLIGKFDALTPVFILVNSVDVDGWSDLLYQAVARARAVFRGYYIDLEKMDEDLEKGWKELLDEGITVSRRQY